MRRLRGVAFVGLVAAMIVGCAPHQAPTQSTVLDSPTAPGPSASSAPATEEETPLQLGRVNRIAFGSCLEPTQPHPILDVIRNRQPDVFMMTGDNVYADAMAVGDLERAYAALGESSSYQALASSTQLLAAWDDHDYGRNDAGKEFELKAESKRVMLDFFGVPPDAARRLRPGNYDAVVLGPEGARVQVILLDARWFRDPLVAGGPGQRYRPSDDPGATVLGAEQWTWLEAQLREPAELRLLVTGIQLLTVEHGFESWGLFPSERAKMFELLRETRAEGVVIVTGDRHRGEISCAYDPAIGYPLIEITASSFNRPNGGREDNDFRLGPPDAYGDPNFGEIDVRWEPAPRLRLALRDETGEPLFSVDLELERLKPDAGTAGVPGCIRLRPPLSAVGR